MNSCQAKAAAWSGVAAGAPPFPLANGGFSSDGTIRLAAVIEKPGAAWAAGASKASPKPTAINPAALRDQAIAHIEFPPLIRSASPGAGIEGSQAGGFNRRCTEFPGSSRMFHYDWWKWRK